VASTLSRRLSWPPSRRRLQMWDQQSQKLNPDSSGAGAHLDHRTICRQIDLLRSAAYLTLQIPFGDGILSSPSSSMSDVEEGGEW